MLLEREEKKWLGRQDSNLQSEIQSLVCYRLHHAPSARPF